MTLSVKRMGAAGIGIVSVVFGAFLRLQARDIAWPRSYSFSGPREDTIWAIKEQAYADCGLVLAIFGLVVVLVVLIHWLWAIDTEKQP